MRRYRNDRGARGRGRGGLRGDRSKGVFYKLLKDESAKMRSREDALRFIIGMESFESKAELLGLLDDNRYTGPRRIEEAVQTIEDTFHVNNILVRIIACVINDETNRPMYKRVRNRVLAAIHYVPGMYGLLIEIDAIESIPMSSADILCGFFEETVMAFVDARNSDEIKKISKALEIKGTEGASKLCNLLLINREETNTQTKIRSHNTSTHSGVAGCWVNDMVPPGGRHDNDFENFRDIQLVPTDQEIRCEQRPWLPLASQENAFIENREIRMLDANFRLLREDAVSTMKTNIDESSRVWENARIVGWYCKEEGKNGKNRLQPLTFLLQLDGSKKSKKTNWERARALPHGGVFALLDPKSGEVCRMGTITVRNHKDTSQWLHHPEGPIIGVTFDKKDDFISSLQEAMKNMAVKRKAKSDSNTKDDGGKTCGEKPYISYNLVEASGSFFSYRPILSALQGFTSMPLADELVHLQPSTNRPEYLPAMLRMPVAESFKGFICELDNPSSNAIVASTSLDKSQAEAILNVFTSKVALVQGPPGTGKTFIGSLIAQMIRENTDESILCVCYTNHALDQFLEYLWDQGERKIVRIGGRSKSSKLTPFNLRELARTKAQLPRDAERRMKCVHAKLHSSSETITELVAQLNEPLSWTKPNGGASLVLSEYHPEVYDTFMSMESIAGEGFQIVSGKKNKSVTAETLFNEWKNGSECPEWLVAYSHFQPELVDFWNKGIGERTEMLDEWHDLLLEDVKERVKEEANNFTELNAERESIGRERDKMILQDARVIGATTNGAAKYRDIISAKSPGVVIVEEAGEVLEPHIISALAENTPYSNETKHLILIGDHLQLRPKLESYKLSTVSGAGYNFDCSLFERLIKSRFPSTMLQVQHRMRPYISEFIRQQTYPTLKDHASVSKFEDVKGVACNVAFIHHDKPEDRNGNADETKTTKSNKWEADMCVELVRYLLLQGYAHSQITVLTPYVGQVLLLLNTMRSKMHDTSAYISDLDREEILGNIENEDHEIELDSTNNPSKESVRCSSIDNFQGEESDIIIASLVRSNTVGNIGFLKEEQRVNVLLSRARIGLYIIGNSKTLQHSPKGAHVWNPILQSLERDRNLLTGFPTTCQLHPADAVVEISDPKMFRQLCPNGGCTRPCNSRLECGHACTMACHPTDRNHLLAHKNCTRPCRRIPPKCKLNHICPKLCNEECGKCETIVKRTKLLCGHWLERPTCHEVRDEDAIRETTRRCKEKVEFQFSCGHRCTTTCANTQRESPRCEALCGKKMDCGHECKRKCHDCDGKHSCKTKCGRQLLCGHICNKLCHGTSPCPPCKNECDNHCLHSRCRKKCSSKCSSCVEPCAWKCKHQGQCALVCGAPCSRLPCNKRCEEKLKCGHQCPSLCGEPCPSEKYCQLCCSEKVKSHAVDMFEFKEYKDIDLNHQPIIVLPCGHFYTVETLDGLFDLSQAYEIDQEGNFIATKPLLRTDLVKPKCCPDCRSPVHSILRYGRLLSFLRLRFLERKHLISVESALKVCTYRLSNDASGQDLSKIAESLNRTLKEINDGPTKKVFEACGGDSQVEVPRPPSKPLIQVYKLLGYVYARQIEELNDEKYQDSINNYAKAIGLCNETKSLRLGYETRISLARLILHWSQSTASVKSEVFDLLDPITSTDVPSHFKDLSDEAMKLKKEVEIDDISKVIRAMNVVGGYDYGGSWSSHWYECPNGHPYFIGECGGAMQVATCIECGERVGGTSHQLLQSNRSAGTTISRIADGN